MCKWIKHTLLMYSIVRSEETNFDYVDPLTSPTESIEINEENLAEKSDENAQDPIPILEDENEKQDTNLMDLFKQVNKLMQIVINLKEAKIVSTLKIILSDTTPAARDFIKEMFKEIKDGSISTCRTIIKYTVLYGVLFGTTSGICFFGIGAIKDPFISKVRDMLGVKEEQ